MMETSQLEQALLPYEKRLRAQERRRKILGVRKVARPTYERYVTGTVQRFDRRKEAFELLNPENPFGEELRQRFKARTGYATRDQLPYSALEPEDRIGQSIRGAAFRLANEYHPKALPVTPSDGRLEVRDKAWVTRLVKKVALLFGAEMAFITRVDQRWVYENVDVPHEYAIIAVVSHPPSLFNTSPSHFSGVISPIAYSRLKFITTQLADFIRGLGYDAAYHDVVGADTHLLMVPMAIDAGVGEFTRNGRVLSPEFGINMRLMAVTTDLVLDADSPISFGVHEFCTVCENCATYCPANAIPFGPPTDAPRGVYNNPGFRKWYENAERCITFWSMNKKKWTSCGGKCIAVCPWSKPVNLLHDTVRWTAIHSPALVRKWLVWGDRVLYKRTNKISK